MMNDRRMIMDNFVYIEFMYLDCYKIKWKRKSSY